MRGNELASARALLREQLTRQWEEAHAGQAATMDRLTQYATESAGGNRSTLIRNAMVVRTLRGFGVSQEAIADAMHVDVSDVDDHQRRQLVAPPDVATAIEEEVLQALPETPEPQRFVPAVDAQAGSTARWDAKAQLIEDATRARATATGGRH